MRFLRVDMYRKLRETKERAVFSNTKILIAFVYFLTGCVVVKKPSEYKQTKSSVKNKDNETLIQVQDFRNHFNPVELEFLDFNLEDYEFTLSVMEYSSKVDIMFIRCVEVKLRKKFIYLYQTDMF